jgi:hypothetical protein
MDRDEWFADLYGCLADMGATAYDETEAIRLYERGYSPADAAGELACDGEE